MEAIRVAPLAKTSQQAAILPYIADWFVLALGTSLSGCLDNVPSSTVLIAGAVVPSAIYFGLYFGSAGFRRRVLGLDLRAVTLVQILRMVGSFAFLEYRWGNLPGIYAVTTGVTDITFGLTSYYVAGRRRGIVYWHALGVFAQMISGGLGILTSGTELGLLAGGVTSQAMSEFPLSLVPLFFGPVTLIFHLIAFCILRNRPDRIRTVQSRRA